MTITGSVTALDEPDVAAGRGGVTVAVTGSNSQGDHVTGTVRVLLPLSGVPAADEGGT
jgi:hypothetical protein